MGKLARERIAGQAVAGGAVVERAVEEALARAPHGVALAVSGGRDSMVLLHVAARVAPARVARVATYDHRSGPHSAAAAALVRQVAAECGFAVDAGAAGAAGAADRVRATEAGWRAARWAFLREVAAAHGLAVATAHTEDDQVETVFMRLLRGAGPRGLAGLQAPGPVLRPLLAVPRAAVAAYAAAHGVRFLEDPSNASRRHLRNRVRLDLLPAIDRLRPGFRAELLELGARAAAWRGAVEALAAGLGEVDARTPPRALRVPAAVLSGLAPDELAVLWPALAARVGVTLDRRGTSRAAGFTTGSRSGDSIPLSGGATVRRTRDRFVLLAEAVDIAPGSPDAPGGAAEAVRDGAACGAFRFRAGVVGPDGARAGELSPWAAEFDRDARVTVRAWAPGDRMQLHGGSPARRVKRFLSDARVPTSDRPGWPVVLVDGEIAWIPGVRRSDAATVRPGRPGVRYECDRNDG